MNPIALRLPTLTRPRIVTLGALSLALFALTVPTRAAEPRWTFTPYAWATDVGVDASLDGRQVVDETIPVGDLLEDLDTIVQGRLELQFGAHGVMLDVFDVTLSDEQRGLALPQGVGSADLDSDAGMTLVDVAGTFDPDGDRLGFALVYGMRVLNERATIDATFALAAGSTVVDRYETSETFVDGLLGVRFTKRLAPRWTWQMQADASSGGTDWTWSTHPSLAYAFGSTGRYALSAGYRRLQVEFEEHDGLESSMTLSGAVLGFHIGF